MSKDAKLIRGQVRQVAQEILTQEVGKALALDIQKALLAHLDARLDAIDKHIKSQLEAIDQRAKDLQSYLVRTTSEIKPPHV